MSGEVERHDLSLRISDADRERVAELLREAAGEGRIDFGELDERLEATYSAKVYGDLLPIVVDLPSGGLNLTERERHAGRPVVSPASDEAAAHHSSIAIMGGQDRQGVWEIGASHTAFALMGEVKLDLRRAAFGASEVVITANAVLGGIDIIVNPNTRVVVEGIGIMGSFDQGRDRVEAEIDADSPTVRIKGVALMGAVEVIRKAPPDPNKRGWRRAIGG